MADRLTGKDPVPSTAFADAWTQVDATENPQFFVHVLDATRTGLLERARRSPDEFFARFAPAPGLDVLDVGCGTGDMLRLLAPLVAPGRAVGIDISSTMIGEARARTAADSPNVHFELGDIFDLRFEDRAFDRVMAGQVLVHLADPWTGLERLCRVLGSKGKLWITEMDWGSIMVESTDRELSRRFTRLTADGLRNGHIVRELPWRLRKLGFATIAIEADVRFSDGADALHRWFIEPAVSHFRRTGAFSPEEAEAFLDDLGQRAAEGRYFSSLNSYSMIASR